ncbi:nicotinate-nucleotide adenylyltransferase [Primorskyibacter sp. 2E107]|uniref:nicotinate-nucleotide adenylyltransferase n=1 Tax=Primorskyibacter sp. 2E107 TaxID=3403458 RepID=UPI003AF6B3C0
MRWKDGMVLRPGMRVGVLGGSFDPPHVGHLHLSREALKRFGLDRVVWLVSPGNPLKRDAPAPIDRRIAVARALVDHPRILVSDFERRVGSRYTARTLALMQGHWPGVRFVWLMGADNLASLHLWQDWKTLMDRVPVGVLARPTARLPACNSVAAEVYQSARLPAHSSRLLGSSAAPCWCFINIPMKPHSSSAIRASGGWQR